MMKIFYGLSTEFFFFFSLSADTGSSSWSSYNIFFKIFRYTSSENTVVGGRKETKKAESNSEKDKLISYV